MRRRPTIVATLLAAGILAAPALAADGPITTFAGTIGGFAGDGGPATAALLNQPEGSAVAPDGAVLIADSRNHVIRRVAPSGVITTVAGTSTSEGLIGDGGQATLAQLDTPTDVAFGPDGSYYIADQFNDRIRRVDRNGVITTFAGTIQGLSGDSGPATSAQLDSPRELAIMPDGALLVVDAGNHRIRRIAGGIITTVAGTVQGFAGDGGPATAARLSNPRGVTPAAGGGFLIADAGNNRIRRVDAAGVIRTVVGSAAGFVGDGGLATAGRVAAPSDVIEIANGGMLIADTANNRIRRVTPLGTIFTIAGGAPGLAGDGGPASAGLLNTPNALQFAPGGGILVGDTANNRIRRLGDIGRLPDPVRAASIGVTPVAGTVAVQPASTTGFIPLREPDLTPNGSAMNAAAGSLDVQVTNATGVLRTARVSGGGFVARQSTSSAVLTDLRLSDKLPGCVARVTSGHAEQAVAKRTRRLKVRVKGKFRTIGRYASAIARGTAWTIVDGCDRTVVRVTEGVVTVRVLRTGRPITVRAGQTRTILRTAR